MKKPLELPSNRKDNRNILAVVDLKTLALKKGEDRPDTKPALLKDISMEELSGLNVMLDLNQTPSPNRNQDLIYDLHEKTSKTKK
jgi:hypothetical protein